VGVATLLLCRAGTAGDLGVAATFARSDVSNWTVSAVDRTIGWEFTVQQTIDVAAIGVYDRPYPSPDPGIATAKEVAIWDLSQALLVSASLPAGSEGTLCEDDYRYVEIAPVTLYAGNTYVVGAYWPASPMDHLPALPSSGIVPDFDSAIAFVKTRILPSAFGFPTNPVLDTSGVGAVNFRIADGECNSLTPPDLATTFASNNEFAGNMFNLRATNQSGVTVTGWQVNIADPDPMDTPVNISVYWREGSYLAGANTIDGWNHLGTTAVLSRGPNRGTPIPVGGLYLPYDQVIGVYVFVTDYLTNPPPATVPKMKYTSIPPASNSYVDANVMITGGLAKGVPHFTGSTTSNRMWNGGVDYVIGVVPGDVTGDGHVNVLDLVEVVLTFGECPARPKPCPADVDDNGAVDVQDIVTVILGWTG
jgi:hypothetical protein